MATPKFYTGKVLGEGQSVADGDWSKPMGWLYIYYFYKIFNEKYILSYFSDE